MPASHRFWICIFLFLSYSFLLSNQRLQAQQGTTGGGDVASTIKIPILGYVFDPVAIGLRPIVGIPGAATLGLPISLDFNVDYAAVSPRQNFALALRREDRQLLQVSFSQAQTTAHLVSGPGPGIDQIFFSRSGTSVALYYRQYNDVQVWTGFPGLPTLSTDFDLTNFAGVLTSMAVHDDGAVLLASFTDEQNASLFLLRTGRDRVLISSFSDISAISFLHQGYDAVLSDRGVNKAYYVSNPLTSPQVDVLALEQDGLLKPVAVELSPDDNQLLIAGATSTITMVTLPTRAVSSFQTAAPVNGFQRMLGKSEFALSQASSGPLFLFDGDSGEPRIVMVPPANVPANPGGSRPVVHRPIRLPPPAL